VWVMAGTASYPDHSFCNEGVLARGQSSSRGSTCRCLHMRRSLFHRDDLISGALNADNVEVRVTESLATL
jgi:hypothetical protein